MGSKNNPPGSRTRRSLSVIIVIGCGVLYLLGAWQRSGFGKGDSIVMKVMKETECSPTVTAGSRTLDIDLTTLSSTHHVERNPSDAPFCSILM
ncbi:unnamed protein product [Rhodiola kirilowii]